MDNAVLQTLMTSDEYFTKTFPELDLKYFGTIEGSTIFTSISEYVEEHNVRPTLRDIGLRIKNSAISEKLKQSTLQNFKILAQEEKIQNVKPFLKDSADWMIKHNLTESIYKSVQMIKEDEKFEPIPEMFKEALSTSFDKDKGLDYNTSLEHRLEYYKQKHLGLETGASIIDNIMGGVRKKTLTVISSPSHGGKSSYMVNISAHNVLKGKNVLYITLEMPEEEIAKRVDANILDIDMNTFQTIDKDTVHKQFNAVAPVLGKLVIKEYSAGVFTTMMLEALVNELKDDGFHPDIISIDYLGLMASTRTSVSKTSNTNTYFRLIAEELHGYAKQHDVALLTAAQLNRSAFGNHDVGMESVAEAISIAQTADVMVALISTDEMRELNQVLVKFIKNRNTGNLGSAILHVDYPKMRYTNWTEENGTQPELPSTLPTPMNTSMNTGIDLSGVIPTDTASQVDIKEVHNSLKVDEFVFE